MTTNYNDEEQKRLIVLLQNQVIDLMEIVTERDVPNSKVHRDDLYSVELQNQIVSLVEIVSQRDAKIAILENSAKNDCKSVPSGEIEKLKLDFDIVKSQKDKLTKSLKNLEKEFGLKMSHDQKKILENNEFNIEEFKRVMTKANAENERLKEQNRELNNDIVEIQGVIGSFQENQQSNDSIISQLKSLEAENQSHAESIKEKNKLLAEFSDRIDAMKNVGQGQGAVTLEDMKELRLEFDSVSKRNDELEVNNEKYKIAVEAQKKYIKGLTNAMDLSDQARDKMKEEIQALISHRDQLADQVKAYENLAGANSHREVQLEKYRNALEAKNTESGKFLETFKTQIVSLRKDRDTANETVAAKEKLIESYKTQSNTMKQLINSYERENAHQKKENDLLLVKVNKLLEINNDLIKAREDDILKKMGESQEAQQNQTPKIVMQGTPESEAEFLKAQLTSASLERDVDKYKTLNLKLRQENNIQSDQVESLNKKLLVAETLAMEKSEKIRSLEKKVQNASNSAASATPSAQKEGPSEAEFMQMAELNQKMSTGMKEMQQAVMDTRREKNEIIAKSEKLINLTKDMKAENERLTSLVITLQDDLEKKSKVEEKSSECISECKDSEIPELESVEEIEPAVKSESKTEEKPEVAKNPKVVKEPEIVKGPEVEKSEPEVKAEVKSEVVKPEVQKINSKSKKNKKKNNKKK